MYILLTGYVCMYVCKYLMYICKAGESERERARRRKMQASNAAARFRLACACECVCELCLCVPLCALLVCVCALCLFVCTSNFCFGKNSCVSSHSLSLSLWPHFSHFSLVSYLSHAVRFLARYVCLSFSFPLTPTLSLSLPVSLSFSLGVFFAQMQFTFKASIKMH